MKRLFVVLFVIFLEIVFVAGCSRQSTITKKLPVKAGQEVQVLLFELAGGNPLMIDHGKILKKDLPKGVVINGGSIDGISREDGELTITLTWNKKKETYETNVFFERL